jgi:hypothetical protein
METNMQLLQRFIMVDCCLAFCFQDLAKIGQIMAMVTMGRAISSRISNGFGQYSVNG